MSALRPLPALLIGVAALLAAFLAPPSIAHTVAARLPASLSVSPDQARLVVADGVAYVQVQVFDPASSRGRMALAALALADGAERWRVDLGDSTFLLSDPAGVAATVYAGTSTGLV